jgi:hypothetical protein
VNRAFIDLAAFASGTCGPTPFAKSGDGSANGGATLRSPSFAFDDADADAAGGFGGAGRRRVSGDHRRAAR